MTAVMVIAVIVVLTHQSIHGEREVMEASLEEVERFEFLRILVNKNEFHATSAGRDREQATLSPVSTIVIAELMIVGDSKLRKALFQFHDEHCLHV